MDNYMTEQEVEKYTGIKAGTLRVYRSLKMGFPYYKIGKLVRYKKVEIDEFIKKNKVEHDSK